MKTFDVNTILELIKEGYRVFLFIDLELGSGTYRFNNSDIDLPLGGNIYTSRDFVPDRIPQSGDMGVDTVSLNFNSSDGVIPAIILSEDIQGRNATIKFACLDDNYQIIVAEPIFSGTISNWKMRESSSMIEIKNDMILWNKKTLRTCQSSCPWEFKGTECTYAGAIDWCDRSYEHCVSLDNSDNFGGFRFLPSIMEKEIYWGRNPKK